MNLTTKLTLLLLGVTVSGFSQTDPMPLRSIPPTQVVAALNVIPERE
mgnify:CR=1 FL=1